jgi:hypothetical protein
LFVAVIQQIEKARICAVAQGKENIAIKFGNDFPFTLDDDIRNLHRFRWRSVFAWHIQFGHPLPLLDEIIAKRQLVKVIDYIRRLYR